MREMIGVYDYTVIATYLASILGMLGIFYVADGRVLLAVCLLLVSGFLDSIDGRIARTKKNRTEIGKNFGIQIDSLNDVICFGLLPAAIVYRIVHDSMKEYVPLWAALILCFFCLAGLIRLAYFNVTEEERQDSTTETRKLYQGIPVTTVALALPLVFWIYDFGILPEIAFPILLLLLAIGFISPLKVQKPGNVGKIFVILIGVANFVIIARDLLFLNK